MPQNGAMCKRYKRSRNALSRTLNTRKEAFAACLGFLMNTKTAKARTTATDARLAAAEGLWCPESAIPTTTTDTVSASNSETRHDN
jgi:hypothetical protein